ncbi:MarR family transcriptional regulator [Candidatus Micrarchaeota archaeon]|nr:MarR family transcriptional regulator [Candidatus Micrarchaeota archaeon]
MDEAQVERIAKNLGSFIRIFQIMRNRSETAGLRPPPLDPQYVMLAFLNDGPLPMSELSRKLGCSKPNITALADRLIDEGLARRQHDRADRRIIRMEITGSGRAVIEGRKKAARTAIRANLSGLDRDELDTLCESLERINRIIAKLDSD